MTEVPIYISVPVNANIMLSEIEKDFNCVQ